MKAYTVEVWDGTLVYIKCGENKKHKLYVSGYYRGHYNWVWDYSVARAYSRTTAKKHVERLNKLNYEAL